jgi:hypothetical protein
MKGYFNIRRLHATNAASIRKINHGLNGYVSHHLNRAGDRRDVKTRTRPVIAAQIINYVALIR